MSTKFLREAVGKRKRIERCDKCIRLECYRRKRDGEKMNPCVNKQKFPPQSHKMFFSHRRAFSYSCRINYLL